MKEGVIYQGSLNKAGSLRDNLAKLLRYNTVILSHVNDGCPDNGCVDTAYPQMHELLYGLVSANPRPLVYGYVPGTSDAPVGSGCGYTIPYSQQHWDPPNGVCSNFIDWTNAWMTLGVDGIFIDVAAYQYMSTVIRNSLYAYVHMFPNGRIIANSTTPSGPNIKFAAEGLLPGRDKLMVEGYCYDEGDDTVELTSEAIWTLRNLYPGIGLAALCTEKPAIHRGDVVTPFSTHDMNARSLFENYQIEPDFYLYHRSDLGLYSEVIGG